MSKVLLVDDEEVLRTSLRYALGKEGFLVTTAADGPEALEQAETFRPDVIVLDVMLPGLDGFEVCRRLRERADDTPVILLTAKDQVTDRVSGLDIGADDYVTKPFNTRELVARMHAVLRRKRRVERALAADRELVARLEELVSEGGGQETGATQRGGHGIARSGPVELDLERQQGTIRGVPLALGSAEFRLLAKLLEEPGRVVTRTELLDAVFGGGGGESLALLEATVRMIREKIEADPTQPRWVVGVPGIGYVFERARE